jgi:hypothetical protein
MVFIVRGIGVAKKGRTTTSNKAEVMAILLARHLDAKLDRDSFQKRKSAILRRVQISIHFTHLGAPGSYVWRGGTGVANQRPTINWATVVVAQRNRVLGLAVIPS